MSPFWDIMGGWTVLFAGCSSKICGNRGGGRGVREFRREDSTELSISPLTKAGPVLTVLYLGTLGDIWLETCFIV